MPWSFSVLLNRFQVPPYRSVELMTLSPTRARFWSAKAEAAWPDDRASAATPPSSAATRCSSTSLVGFMIRV